MDTRPRPNPLHLALIPIPLALLYFFPPDHYPFYPACPFHTVTGLLCPGCGATRALAALTHLHFAHAWQANPLIVLIVPFAILYAVRPFKLSPPAIAALITLTLTFAVLRNL